MLLCRACRQSPPDAAAVACHHLGFAQAVLTLGLIGGLYSHAAWGQLPNDQAPATPPTKAMLRDACVTDHAKFCPSGEGGTRADVACLRQHHVSLALGCRRMLARATVATGVAATSDTAAPQ